MVRMVLWTNVIEGVPWINDQLQSDIEVKITIYKHDSKRAHLLGGPTRAILRLMPQAVVWSFIHEWIWSYHQFIKNKNRILFYKKDLFILSERGRKGEREGEKYWCVRDTSIGCLSYASNWGPGPKPRHVPWLGIEQGPFSSQASKYSIHRATPARVEQEQNSLCYRDKSFNLQIKETFHCLHFDNFINSHKRWH